MKIILKDFYFSEELDKILHQSCRHKDEKYVKSEVCIDGKWFQFNEQIKHDKQRVNTYNDSIFIGTTDDQNTRYNYKGV